MKVDVRALWSDCHVPLDFVNSRQLCVCVDRVLYRIKHVLAIYRTLVCYLIFVRVTDVNSVSC